MKANKQSKIRVKNSGYKRSRFNWSHDVNTTFAWGEIQPTQCKLLIPGSKTTQQVQNLVRLAPMVAPTFGRVKYKTFNQFVEMAEVFPNWDAMMAQEPKSTASGKKVPQAVPTIKLGKLSAYVLMGARATLYWAQGATEADRLSRASQGLYNTVYKPAGGSLPSEATGHIMRLTNNGLYASTTTLSNYCADVGSVNNRVYIKPGAVNSIMSPVYSLDGTTYEAAIALGNSSMNNLIATDPSLGAEYINQNFDACDREVSFEGSDYVIEFNVTDNNQKYYYALALECSDYGKRIRKTLQGLGYQIDFASTEEVSILPLLAQYKAYFDIFGLQLYSGWETTSASKLIKIIENEFVTGMDSSFKVLPCTNAGSLTSNQTEFGRFMLVELGNEFYTEDADYIGAHIASLSVSPQVDESKFISINAANVVSANVSDSNYYNTDGTSYTQDLNGTGANIYGYTGVGMSTNENGAMGYINSTFHSQVDAELLKRMYKWVNRNTILGREIAKILRAQGLGKYVDECKSNFIGSSDTLITISDVIAQSNTYDSATKEGALLGQYGGRGLQYDASGTLVFENDSYGYWITLSTIVPEAGYTQGLDPTLTCKSKFDMYLPDFDAVGMEATPKSTVIGNRFNVRYDENDLTRYGDTFGFIPRMSKFKICQNLTNGDFNRHSLRNTYLPYTLDKQLNVNDFDVSFNTYVAASGSSPAGNAVVMTRSMDVNALPVASPIWRTPTKYAWMGNFDRIFYNVYDENASLIHKMSGDIDVPTTLIGFVDYNEDNFLSHAIYNVQCYAPMKPIENSYGLDEDEPDTIGVQTVDKAG